MVLVGVCCDYGLYLGVSVDNYLIVKDLVYLFVGLKMYLNEIFITFRFDDMSSLSVVKVLFRYIFRLVDRWVRFLIVE